MKPLLILIQIHVLPKKNMKLYSETCINLFSLFFIQILYIN
jgi:hypothetical protein